MNKRWGYWLFFAALFLAPFYLTEFRLSLLGKFLCFAIVAVGISLIWGHTGILSLGHGVYFGLGAYCMAMYLKLEASRGHLPDFMEWSGVRELPWFWKPFAHPMVAIAAAIALPTLLAALLSYFTFKNRIQGVYFSLLSQAVVVVFVTLFIGKQEWTGGTNGLTNFFDRVRLFVIIAAYANCVVLADSSCSCPHFRYDAPSNDWSARKSAHCHSRR
ncbi:Branched-chain amino acid transport system / permease component [Geobacillus sp. BCO2]|nr:Branched-chain amino acid transport system / permease component [Geobacillus sp. BCO2]